MNVSYIFFCSNLSKISTEPKIKLTALKYFILCPPKVEASIVDFVMLKLDCSNEDILKQ